MEKVIIHFSLEAKASFESLKAGPPLLSQLAIRYYNALFEFPPEAWLRVRHDLGHDTFISDRHCAFDIRGTVEGASPPRTLLITHFQRRKDPGREHTKKHTKVIS